MRNKKQRILTGDRPTGPLHVGHLVGSLNSRVELQDTHDTYILIADLHVLTTKPKADDIAKNTRQVVRDNISAGVDPKKVTFFLQSAIPEIGELAIILGMYTTVNRLQRIPTLKDVMKSLHIEQPSFGLLGYPVLQTADILSFGADIVPVGEDQLSHIELTREIARRFNMVVAKDVLNLPKPYLAAVPRLSGTDGQAKMGKSLGNAISLSDSKEDVKKKVMGMYTDPNRLRASDPGKVEGNPVFQYHDAFNDNKAEVEELKGLYEKGQVGDVEVKEKLLVALEKVLVPIREKQAITDQEIDVIIKAGTEKARKEAVNTLDQVKKALSLYGTN